MQTLLVPSETPRWRGRFRWNPLGAGSQQINWLHTSHPRKGLLEQSEEDYKQGKVISQKALEKESRSW